MEKSLNIRLLKETEVPQMFQAFLDAFSDYEVPFEMNLEGFKKKFIDKLSLDFSASAGAFINDRLVGFMFITINEYEGSKTAYNGGTGVLPECRGERISSRLWDFVKPRVKLQNVEKCVLEVLTSNTPAIGIYEKLGFRKVKHFKCYRLLPYRYTQVPSIPTKLRLVKASKPNWPVYSKFFDYSPSFIDSQAMIDKNIHNEEIIEAYIDDNLTGYIIFQSPIGRISHLAVSPEFRNQGIGTRLLGQAYKESKTKYLTVINLPEPAQVAQRFLTNLGFQNQLDQYEMSLLLN